MIEARACRRDSSQEAYLSSASRIGAVWFRGGSRASVDCCLQRAIGRAQLHLDVLVWQQVINVVHHLTKGGDEQVGVWR